MKKVLVFGTFDVLHPGHLNFFKQAKVLGDQLCVAIARDKTVKDVKQHHPTQKEQQRLQQIQNCEDVDQAVLGYYDDKYRIIQEIKPAIIALGYDQTHFVDNLELELKKRKLNCDIVRLKPFHPEIYKSSIIKNQI